MFNKLVEYFIKNKPNKLSYQEHLDRLFLRTVLILFILVNIAWVLSISGIFLNEAPYILFNIGTITSLLIYKFCGNLSLSANVFSVVNLVLLFKAIGTTGGIYSYNLRWLMFVIFISFLFNNPHRNSYRAPFIFFLLSIAIIFYYFYLDYIGVKNYLSDKLLFSNFDYLIENLFYIITISGLAYFFHQTQKKITDILFKQSEKLEKTSKRLIDSNKSLESYAYATSHDMKEPVRTIVSFTQLLEKEIGSENLSVDAIEYMKYIKSGTKRISELIDGVLDFSKINNPKENEFKKFKVNKILDEIVADLSNKIKIVDATIKYKELPIIYANELQIKRVFLNLITNALKFKSEQRSLIISISIIEDENKYLFSVDDNGKGIPKEKLDYIFEPFKRLDFSEDGSGIGLATCKKIIQLHNGDIWAESNEGEGACFKFTIEKIKA